jgi:hypothetical protein
MTRRARPSRRTFQWLASWGVVLPRRTPWRNLSSRQRRAMVTRGAVQLAAVAVALNDLRRRPPAQIRGPRIAWVAVCCVNYLGMGPAAYFLLGRRRTDAAPTTNLKAPLKQRRH